MKMKESECCDPGFLEVVTCVAVSAFREASTEEGLPFFSNIHGVPDRGISAALDNLGFVYTNLKEAAPDDAVALALLKGLTKKGMIAVGPSDMEFPSYDPNRRYPQGVERRI